MTSAGVRDKLGIKKFLAYIALKYDLSFRHKFTRSSYD